MRNPKLSSVPLACFLLSMMILGLAFCKSKKGQSLGLKYQQLDSISSAQWAALAGKRIFFGHKSVGQNIMTGIEEVLGKYPAISLDTSAKGRDSGISTSNALKR